LISARFESGTLLTATCKAGMVALPGFGASTVEGIHFLVILAADATQGEVERCIGNCDVRDVGSNRRKAPYAAGTAWHRSWAGWWPPSRCTELDSACRAAASLLKQARRRNQSRSGGRLRHTFGTHMAAAGVPMRTLQEWMGHRDFKTTLIYADYMPGEREADLVDLAFARPDPGTNSGTNLSVTEAHQDPPIPDKHGDSD
jgi:hypothetical protein